MFQQRAQGLEGYQGFDGDLKPEDKFTLEVGKKKVTLCKANLLKMAVRTRAVNLLKRAREAQTPNTALQNSTM